MDEPAPVRVLLPTVTPTPVIDQVAGDLRSGDELLVLCDAASDPVADAVESRGADSEDIAGQIRLVVAGEPSGCSGKSNAIAVGMEAARNDVLVWTDDDFEHPPDWLSTLRADYRRQGPTTELPVFVGQDPLSVLLEPTNVLFGTAGVRAADKAWGGAVIFGRDDLRGSEASFLADLWRTVSDDGLLAEYLDLTASRRVREVPAGGSLRATLERHVRFTQIAYRHEPRGMTLAVLASVPTAVACLLFALPAALVLTAASGALYAGLGIRRWTFLLAYPASVLGPPLALYALARRTFVWGGRRHRWRSKFDVDVLE